MERRSLRGDNEDFFSGSSFFSLSVSLPEEPPVGELALGVLVAWKVGLFFGKENGLLSRKSPLRLKLSEDFVWDSFLKGSDFKSTEDLDNDLIRAYLEWFLFTEGVDRLEDLVGVSESSLLKFKGVKSSSRATPLSSSEEEDCFSDEDRNKVRGIGFGGFPLILEYDSGVKVIEEGDLEEVGDSAGEPRSDISEEHESEDTPEDVLEWEIVEEHDIILALVVSWSESVSVLDWSRLRRHKFCKEKNKEQLYTYTLSSKYRIVNN